MNAGFDFLNPSSSSAAVAVPYGCCPKPAPGVDTPPEVIVVLVALAEQISATMIRQLPAINRALGMLRQ